MLIAAGSARADCFDEAAKYQKVNPLILRAIAWQESHNRPDALHKNANGSTDYGVMQINSIHLPIARAVRHLARHADGTVQERLYRGVASAPPDEQVWQYVASGRRVSLRNAGAAR